MKRLAIFVEGKTEELFLDKLISKIPNSSQIAIQRIDLIGKQKVSLDVIKSRQNKKYYVLIVNCGADNRVASGIRDNYDGLIRNNYNFILGLRDVYPLTHQEITKLRTGLLTKQKISPVRPVFILSVMEIEAWFLGDYGHFKKIHGSLDLMRVRAICKFDPSAVNLEKINKPSDILRRIYKKVSFNYDKKISSIEKILNALDYKNILNNVSQRFEDLKELSSCFKKFLSV
jgi:uncharacterized protein DUF4276